MEFELEPMLMDIAVNISLLTTTQSTIAAELDAFSEVSWFTSAYLVCSTLLSPYQV
jgi:hypothetical protein